MTRIVAIGGGEIRRRETLAFDRYCVRATSVTRPRALFLPTASGDSPGYFEVFQSLYGEELGCDVDVLRLVKNADEREQRRRKIESADLIYVGGGNTRTMLDVWRREGVDQLLRTATKRGAILCGLSAGAMCWFRYGNSDAPLIEGAPEGAPKTVRVDGLGLVDAALCPHMTTEPFRWSEVEQMMRVTPGTCIALDDMCAIEVAADSYRILAAQPGHRGYCVTSKGVTVLDVVALPRDGATVGEEGFRPLHDLTKQRSLRDHE